MALRQYKTPEGIIKFKEVFAIPHVNRIKHVAEIDFDKASMVVTVGLTLAFEGMNLKRSMNAIQILDLAELIIDSAAEDHLSFEDLFLFLQKLVRGEYGINYESMDIPKFMEKFELYRDFRFMEHERIKKERHLQLKMMGDTEHTNKKDELSEHFSNLGSQINKMKNHIENLKADNKSLKMDNL